ncbi:MAG: metallophosphoesterase [Gammaproteobacteria bacterium]|nr:metallophosphoesterase [Gammaproteobacteria bacterium]
MSFKKYDIIGDIHGHADELIKLLEHLGYQVSDTGYRHESRKVIFLGDFIDRGEHLRQHKKLLDIVMPMVSNGHALAVMGNHEFNALAFHTHHDGEYLRPRTDKNIHQHQAFLNEYESDLKLKQEVLDFFYTLPLWLELDGLRVIHACWDDKHVEHIKTVAPNKLLTEELLVEASTKGTNTYSAIEVLLKGVEIELPDGVSFKDKGGHKRTAVRVQWWKGDASTLGEVTFGIDIGDAAHCAIPETIPTYAEDQQPCFIGHYWLTGEPAPLTNNIACLDYSVANGGKLVAYRWDGEAVLSKEKFMYP